MCQILPLSLLKCGITAPKIAEIGNFWYKFARKGHTPISDFFTIFGVEEGVLGPHPHTKFHCSGFKCGLTAPKSRKVAIFGIYLPLWKNFGGSQKKLDIGAQPQTFLYAMAPYYF